MIAPESIDLRSLPCLSLEDRANLPDVAAIYFAVDSFDEVLYIGRSVSLLRRWTGHHRLSQLVNIGQVKIAWVEISETALLPQVEQALIEFFSPPLNGSEVVGNPVGSLINTVDRLAIAHGIKNAYQFCKKVEGWMPESTARRLYRDRNIWPDKSSVIAICEVFKVQPGDFLAYIPEEDGQRQAS